MRAPRTPPAPRGDTIVEALVATLLLTVGGLALLSLSAVLLRDERRGAARVRAASLFDERATQWTTQPCGGAGGSRQLAGLHETWTVARTADSLEVLRDSVHAPADPRERPLALTALRGCAP
jgi:Tfp pilus assembly protein PilV